MTRTRKHAEKPGKWRCVICQDWGRDLDPRAALERHYMALHYQPPPF